MDADAILAADLAQTLISLSLNSTDHTEHNATKFEQSLLVSNERAIDNLVAPISIEGLLNPAPCRSASIPHIDNAHISAKESKDKQRKSASILSGTPGENDNLVVVIQQACDRHKFSRNVSARDLDAIVERPERSQAALLGILAARECLVEASLPSFSMHPTSRKGSLNDDATLQVHGALFCEELAGLCASAAGNLASRTIEVPPDYPHDDLYLGPNSLEALEGCLGALYDGIDLIFGNDDYKMSHVAIRPPGHHAGQKPCGFCWINNVHIAIAYAQQAYGVQRAAILDFDLHHGDGSQDLAWIANQKRPYSIGYFSVHDINSYPCETGNIDKLKEASVCLDAHGHTIHNIHLEEHSNSAEFLHLYEQKYSVLFKKAAQYLGEGYAKGQKTLVCISAGYDASEFELKSMQRHKVNVPVDFYYRFSRDARKLAEEYADGRLISIMEGGYSNKALISGAMSHVVGLVDRKPTLGNFTDWWSMANLTELEKALKHRSPKRGRKSINTSSSSSWLKRTTDQFADFQVSSATAVDTIQTDLGRMKLRERKL